MSGSPAYSLLLRPECEATNEWHLSKEENSYVTGYKDLTIRMIPTIVDSVLKLPLNLDSKDFRIASETSGGKVESGF